MRISPPSPRRHMTERARARTPRSDAFRGARELADRVLHTELYGDDAMLLCPSSAPLCRCCGQRWRSALYRGRRIAALDVPGVCHSIGLATVIRGVGGWNSLRYPLPVLLTEWNLIRVSAPPAIPPEALHAIEGCVNRRCRRSQRPADPARLPLQIVSGRGGVVRCRRPRWRSAILVDGASRPRQTEPAAVPRRLTPRDLSGPQSGLRAVSVTRQAFTRRRDS